MLDQLDLSDLWDAATEQERQVLVDEMLERIHVYPDRLQVSIHGAPALNVAFSEVGLKESGDSNSSGVGGPLSPNPKWRLSAHSA